jgi:cell division protein FtsZ
MFELGDSGPHNAKIKVIGVGGGGGNAIEHMLSEHIEGVEFIVANTDSQALGRSSAPTTIQLGEEITKGLGAGADPSVGRKAAQENLETIKEVLQGTDMTFITAGMGGGTGTGAAPIIAQAAKELGILTVAVVTKPFAFEGRKRMIVADEGIKELGQYVDSLITIPNNKLLSVLGKNITLLNAFKAANNVLYGAVQGIADLITRPGLINVDFADVRTVMSEMGMAMMGTGSSSGENRAREAADAAIASPLLEDVDFSGAKGVLVNITAGMDMSIGEFEAVGETIKSFTSENATVVVGTVIDPEMSEDLRVTVVITGLGECYTPEGADATVSSSKNLKSDGTLDLNHLQRPTFIRHQGSEQTSDQEATSDATGATSTVTAQESAPEENMVREEERVAVTTADEEEITATSDNLVGDRQSTARSQAEIADLYSSDPLTKRDRDLDYLDIPAFLRREED